MQPFDTIAQVSNFKAAAGLLCAGALAACSSGASAHPVDIKTVFTVESTFGPEFRVEGKGPRGSTPRWRDPRGSRPT